ncbi:molybdenum cofactor guanylyltransferase [Halostella salina]|uniref:molybdenum cofactor guanylyltransferase n=1 Tax=Halostella salina TaxID=1547897 RepID=UPI000EF81148|nr:molybdenum cofactor guanylyltransferase [Halostella salina]
MSTGVIVAGGRSTRFGEADKAVAELAGTPMIRRVADRIAPAVDALVVNCRTDQTAAIREALAGYERPVTYAEDPEPDEGPIAGIRTGLRAVGDEYALVVACDMPFVDPNVATLLFERAEGHDAAVPRRGEHVEPTHAVYRASAMAAACEDTLAAGNRKVADALADLDYVAVDEADIRAVGSLDTFENVNTREGFAAAAERIEAGRR